MGCGASTSPQEPPLRPAHSTPTVVKPAVSAEDQSPQHSRPTGADVTSLGRVNPPVGGLATPPLRPASATETPEDVATCLTAQEMASLHARFQEAAAATLASGGQAINLARAGGHVGAGTRAGLGEIAASLSLSASEHSFLVERLGAIMLAPPSGAPPLAAVSVSSVAVSSATAAGNTTPPQTQTSPAQAVGKAGSGSFGRPISPVTVPVLSRAAVAAATDSPPGAPPVAAISFPACARAISLLHPRAPDALARTAACHSLYDCDGDGFVGVADLTEGLLAVMADNLGLCSRRQAEKLAEATVAAAASDPKKGVSAGDYQRHLATHPLALRHVRFDALRHGS
eukprot:TRINITY_DN4091_c0_g2_i1.p1 TRINITY_DN4091_c0_g2~~TRINITY_DN4091_c0_g2_i1.p1  ORF type:complete len:342 (+),score=53.56 TRINITY_DN4091_c0_g2_i1:192-1217(+)